MTTEEIEALKYERDALLIEVGYLKAALMTGSDDFNVRDERAKACSVMVNEQERWRREVTEWMTMVPLTLRAKLVRQRKELKRLNRMLEYRRSGIADYVLTLSSEKLHRLSQSPKM